jgi:hypothetical protein
MAAATADLLRGHDRAGQRPADGAVLASAARRPAVVVHPCVSMSIHRGLGVPEDLHTAAQSTSEERRQGLLTYAVSFAVGEPYVESQ